MALKNHIYVNVTSIDNGNNDHVSAILHIIVQVVLFGLGLILQVKIIVNARKEKGNTWQIHICHSIVLTIYYAFTIIFAALMHFAPSILGHPISALSFPLMSVLCCARGVAGLEYCHLPWVMGRL